MKRKIIVAIILVIIILLVNFKFNEKQNETQNEVQNEVKNENQNESSTENTTLTDNVTKTEESEVDEVKQQYNITGNSNIYNVETESDGRKVINVKPSVNFKVAFAGMIKNSKPNFEELDSIFEHNAPTQKGIWIKKEDREKILTYVNNNLNYEYEINNEGYLQIKENNNANTIDQEIEKLINGDKQYIFCISSTCYMVDTVTGEIIDNPYNELEPYQTYEYFTDEDRLIIFITENKESEMTKNEIFESLIDLIEFINS